MTINLINKLNQDMNTFIEIKEKDINPPDYKIKLLSEILDTLYSSTINNIDYFYDDNKITPIQRKSFFESIKKSLENNINDYENYQYYYNLFQPYFGNNN